MPTAAVAENLSAVVRGQPQPKAQGSPDVEFKFAEVDVAGIVQKTIDLFHTGTVLEGSLINSGKSSELTVHYDDGGYDRDWVYSLDSGVESALNDLAYSIAFTRQRSTPGFQTMTSGEFAFYIRGLEQYHAYLQSLESQREDLERLTAAIEAWNEAVKKGGHSPRCYVYLASALILAHRYPEAEAALNKARAIDPRNFLVAQNEKSLGLVISNNKPATPTGASPGEKPRPKETKPESQAEVLLRPEAAELIHLREAQEAASKGQPIVVALLSSGYGGPPSGRILSGKSFVEGEQVHDDHEGYGAKTADLILSVAPQARVLPLKVLTKAGFGTNFQILAGLEYALQAKPKVVLAWFGALGEDAAQREAFAALERSGVVAIAPAGNEGTDSASYPAGYPSVSVSVR